VIAVVNFGVGVEFATDGQSASISQCTALIGQSRVPHHKPRHGLRRQHASRKIHKGLSNCQLQRSASEHSFTCKCKSFIQFFKSMVQIANKTGLANKQKTVHLSPQANCTNRSSARIVLTFAGKEFAWSAQLVPRAANVSFLDRSS
jgi:DNA-binding phage protein